MDSSFSEFLVDLIVHETSHIEMGFIAKIVSFDKKLMRATITPMLKVITEEDGDDSPTTVETPNIDNVVVEMLNAGGAYIRPDYKKGDLVKCSLSGSDIQSAIESDQRADTLDNKFSLSYVTVTSGVIPKNFSAPASWAEKSGLLIGFADKFLRISEDGLEFKGDLIVDGDIEADNVIATGDVKAGLISLKTHTHAETGGTTGPPLP